MIPGVIAIGRAVNNPVTFQFDRTTYNTGYVSSGTLILTPPYIAPYLVLGDRVRVDALSWQGGFDELWDPRIAFYFIWGTAYDTNWIDGGSNKNHQIRFTYGGGSTLTIQHRYIGDATDFPKVELSIDRMIYLDDRESPSNFYEANLAA